MAAIDEITEAVHDIQRRLAVLKYDNVPQFEAIEKAGDDLLRWEEHELKQVKEAFG